MVEPRTHNIQDDNQVNSTINFIKKYDLKTLHTSDLVRLKEEFNQPAYFLARFINKEFKKILNEIDDLLKSKLAH